MSAQHTLGRLKAVACDLMEDGGRLRMASNVTACGAGGSLQKNVDAALVNARRLAACWNACEGVATEGIEALAAVGGVAAADTIMKQALAGFEEMKQGIEEEWKAARQLRADLATARALLKKVLEVDVLDEDGTNLDLEACIRAFLKGAAHG